MTASQALVRRMVVQFPALRQLLDAHLEDTDGELLPYLLLGDVARWAHAEARSGGSTVAAVTDWLERAFDDAADEERDLIGLGFVEAIPSAPEGDALLSLLPPRLHRVADELGLLAP